MPKKSGKGALGIVGIVLMLFGLLVAPGFITIIPANANSNQLFTTLTSSQPTFFWGVYFGCDAFGNQCGGGSSGISKALANGGSTQIGVQSGPFFAYYTLQSGATVTSFSIKYCQGSTCTPSQVLTTTTGRDAASAPYITATSPPMEVNKPYTYLFTLSDSNNNVASFQSTLTVIVNTQTVVYVSYIVVGDKDVCVGYNGSGPQIYGCQNINANVQIMPTTDISFRTIFQSQGNTITAVTVKCSATNVNSQCPFTSISLTQGNDGVTWTSTSYKFPVGTYTVHGYYINTSGQTQMFSTLVIPSFSGGLNVINMIAGIALVFVGFGLFVGFRPKRLPKM